VNCDIHLGESNCASVGYTKRLDSIKMYGVKKNNNNNNSHYFRTRH